MEGEKLPLLGAPRSARASRASRVSTAEEARLRNRGKRVKMHSKRLRQLWPQIVTFLALRDVLRLREAEREVFRLELWRVSALLGGYACYRMRNCGSNFVCWTKPSQRKVRSLVWVNAPLVLTLCCLSIWSYGILEDSAVPEPHRSQQPDRPPDQLRGSGEASSPSALVSPVKTFIVVADVLLLVALVILSVGDLTTKALYTVGMLAAIEVAVMVAEFVAWSSPLQIAHSFLVLAMIVLNVVLAAKKKRAYLREVAAFASTY
ncbi:hypothetical protein BBJ28_00012348 [Nothophytophthora sp. Chile5]|nr:hypothetical protein BBJ28_00012348 [Nothophytophthora sp. Chile5]